MKKYYLAFVVLGLLLASCAEAPVTLPPMEKEVNHLEEEVTFVTPSKEAELTTPSGNYILVRYYSTGAFGKQQVFADLYLLDNLVCTWDLKGTLPEDRGDVLYFTPNEDNCPQLDPRNGVSWHTSENFAELLFQEDLEGNPVVVDTLEIWALTSKGYKVLQ